MQTDTLNPDEQAAATSPRTPSLRKTVLLALLTVAALAYALWPRGPRLELYTSPPLTVDGKTVRLQALVPAGWTELITDNGLVEISGPITERTVLLATSQRSYTVYFTPIQRGAWLPGWLRPYLYGPDEPRAELGLIYGWDPFYGMAINGSNLYSDSLQHVQRYAESNPGGRLYYTRTNKAEFDATRQAICESFKVLREEAMQNAK